MDPIAISAVIAGTKTGLEVIKQAAETITSVRSAIKTGSTTTDAALTDVKLADLSESLIEAKVRTLDLLGLAERLVVENAETRGALAKKESFELRSANYHLKDLGRGSVAFVFVPPPGSDIPAHCACTVCFENGRISYLNSFQGMYGDVELTCPNCKAVVSFHGDEGWTPSRAINRRSVQA
jgi:hypothetical protein